MSTHADGDAALSRFDGATALSVFDKILGSNANDDHALAGRVRALWMLRRWDEARTRLKELESRDDSVDVALARGLVALGQPDDPSYLSVDCGSAERDDEAAIKAFESATRLDKSSVDALAGLATAYRMAGRLPRAETVLASARPRLRASAPALLESAMCKLERDDLAGAKADALLAVQDDSASLQAKLLHLELARRTDYGNEELVRLTADLVNEQKPPAAVVLELQGWALLDRAELTGDQQLREQALAEFERSERVGPALPGVINGKILIHQASGRFEEALRVATAAIAREPTSPQLHLSLAEIKAVAGEQPKERLVSYEAVLDQDPRDLNARIAKVRALISLDQVGQARTIVTALLEELPGNTRVEAAQRWLDEPSQVAESRTIERRVEAPWEERGKDGPVQVLDLLTTEVSVKLGLTRPVAGWLRGVVGWDRKVLLQHAFQEEQRYLQERERFCAQAERARKWAALRMLGDVVIGFGVLLGVLQVVAIGLAQGRPSIGWQLDFASGLVLVLLPLIARRWWKKHGVALAATLTVIGGGAILAASIWVNVRQLGAGLGSFFGTATAVGVIGTVLGGDLLRGRFAKPDPLAAQLAFDSWLDSIYSKALLPVAIGASASLKPVYCTDLPVLDVPYSDVPVEIDTLASEDLRELLRQRSKGSFALAGPRGVGKSTLLDRWCAGHFLRDPKVASQVRRDLTIKVDAPVGYQSKEFLTHLFGKLCDAVEGYVPTLTGPGAPALDAGTVTPAELAARAKEERERIRYLQSHTKEGEFSLGVTPLKTTNLGYKRKATVRRDDVPLNHPELVDRFRDFLGQTADLVADRDGKVLIGIDELDRISDGEDAQRFLNELKAVFTVRNCYFLVSVSEDALAEFELSAMGMRTVFDSTFDTVVWVDYFDLDQARSLLSRRIRDLPEQFAALAYVFSGGLARELARTAEAIAAQCSAKAKPLAAVAEHLVQRQLDRTTHAAMDRVRRSPEHRAGAALVPVFDERPAGKLTSGLLRGYAATVAEVDCGKAEPEALADVRLHVVAMVEYLAVLLDVFDGQLDKVRMAPGLASGPGAFENLARVRRYLGANSAVARELLRGFCEAWKLAAAVPAPRDGHARGPSARLGLHHSNGTGR